ncbi:hypothetical protein [Fusibacter ferrireducens]|uniref:Uncharacterized protein n=1 Tax=Fusibacter ferrireducens TaxID=2785058 RepID=A0ABR9ZZ73_9FIRM|nr:hypothetical protein [Fusibacter ferrireducens]MBF4695756.1 hypothetical protein [Fusibacter ferrireducens]
MKKYLSVWMIASRSTLYKIVGLLFLMAGAEIALFYLTLQTDELYTLDTLITKSHIPIISGVAFLMLCYILSIVGYETSGSKIRYSIKRLTVREETITTLWSIYNMGCFIIFLAMQLLVVLFLCHQYTVIMDPMYWHNQTVFLAFYHNPFLHSLLPLEESSRWIRNGAFILALGTTSAFFSLSQRRGKRSISIVVMSFLVFVSFSQDLGNFSSDIFLTLVALSFAGHAFHKIWRGINYDC